jgi:[glutamine synthetase] adenylyltransferase / [glutamine synthetase]-adenylyl-L-tyrosine phosphorylase
MHEFLSIIERLRSHSHYARRLTGANPILVDDLKARYGQPFSRVEMEDFLREESTRNPGELKSALRRLRQRVWLRTAARDLSGLADLAEVMVTMTALAEVAIASAQISAQQDLVSRFGSPIGDESNAPQELIVVAMGKLGGAELNVSSDIDLIFVYPEEGQTNGTRQISNQEFFTLLGKQIIAALADITPEGFVFRVDMRLRPYGDSGALAISFPALEAYFITQGRPWERYAWIKARPISGAQHEALNGIAKPFVFRRYLDYGAVAQLRELHRQIRTEVMRRDRIDNIKLGPGGIREIEFLAQVFQLIRGGRDVRLQDRSTLATLSNLAEMNLVSQENCNELRTSYVFLRNLEHRLQYLDDAQTQILPTDADDQLRIATALGEATYHSALALLDQHRGSVTRQFDAIFSKEPSESKPSTGSLWLSPIGKDESVAYLSKAGYRDANHVYERLSAIQRSSRYQQLPESSRVRFDGLVPAVIEMAAGMPNPDETLIRTLDLFEAVSRRETYLALLLENQRALKKVLELASASGWAVKYLQQHPILLDELLDHRELNVVPDWPKLKHQLQQELLAHDGDVERQWDLLRHFKQAQMFRLIAQDIAGNLALETLSDHLSDLADCLLDITVFAAWRGLKTKHRDVPRFCVIGYGKLGGKELGYGSDLDIIFLYEDAHPDAAEQYGRLAQRLNSWLTTYTPAGMLYDTDLRLRPDGASGLLVSSVEAFEEYQASHAWLWEHQALTRARFCAGDVQVGAAFEKIRIDVLRKERPLGDTRKEINDMREKMRQGHPNTSALFDIKHDAGGLVDIEFIVQYLVLGFAHRHESLVANVGNIALLEMSGALGLIEIDRAHRVATSYRELRRLQHRAWLDGQTQARVAQQIVAPFARPVISLWENLIASSA